MDSGLLVLQEDAAAVFVRVVMMFRNLPRYGGTQGSFIISSNHPTSCKQTHDNHQLRNSAIASESHGHGRTDTESSDQQHRRAEAECRTFRQLLRLTCHPNNRVLPGAGPNCLQLKSISGMNAKYFGLTALSALNAAACRPSWGVGSRLSGLRFRRSPGDAQTPSLGFP